MRALLLIGIPLALSVSVFAQNWDGYQDQNDCTALSGWARDNDDLGATLNVDIYEGGNLIATLPANIYRSDVGSHAFGMATPDRLKDGQAHTITIRYSGSNRNLRNTGQPLTCGTGSPTTYYSSDLGSIETTAWNTNGIVYAAPSIGLSAPTLGSAVDGSIISKLAPPDGSRDYDIRASLAEPCSGNPVFVLYLRASPDARSGPNASGEYYAVELQGACGVNGSNGILTIYKRQNGAITQLLTTTMAVSSPMYLHAWAFDSGGSTQINVFTGDPPNGVAVTDDNPIATGLPGLGLRANSNWPRIFGTAFRTRDRIAPNPVIASSISSWLAPNQVDLRWQGSADDTYGTGTRCYRITRSDLGTSLYVPEAEYSDTTVAAGTTYSYAIQACDRHLSCSTATSISISTPPAGAVEPRRVGVRSEGSYWGGSAENIDVLSGNLNFSIPLVKATGRGGASVTFGLSYNSQNWRQDASGSWRLGADVGFGFGWRFQAGSIQTFWRDYWTLDHFVFIDSTGAEYRLDLNKNGIWSSRQGFYGEYDPASGQLWFPDGSFWMMGAVSSGDEPDAGTRYPTVMQDTNGNQILVRYAIGFGSTSANSSARILEIEDTRATAWSPNRRTYSFTYATEGIPHITGMANHIGSGESYTFSYVHDAWLKSPFDGENSTTAHFLTQITDGQAQQHQLQYDSAGSGELSKATLPHGGWLSWSYTTFTYTGNRSLREVQARYLAKAFDATEIGYSFYHPPGDTSLSLHSSTSMWDSAGTGAKAWYFDTAGRISTFAQASYDWSEIPRRSDYTWGQDDDGRYYVTSTTTTLDQGKAYANTSKSEQTLDIHGNLLQAKLYDYDELIAPARTYTNTYLTGSNYTSRHIWNRLVTASVSKASQTAELVHNVYDGPTSPTIGYCGASAEWACPDPHYRGNPTSRTAKGITTTLTYDTYGNVTKSEDASGHKVEFTMTSNFSVPGAITPNSDSTLSTSINYTPFLAVSSVTRPNTSTTTLSYDTYGRPLTGATPDGALVEYSYSWPGSSPLPHKTFAKHYNGTAIEWQKTTTVDGLGRTIREETASGGTVSVVDTEYQACACSANGKVKRVSQPYRSGATTIYWTEYIYDALGRTKQVNLPGSDGATLYEYNGNVVKVTDPGGNWKEYTTDALGNLIQVTEPTPGGSTYNTTYTYNILNLLATVTMPRDGVTQTRSFNYDLSTGRLNSATNPENGTVTYTYNADGTLHQRTTAQGGITTYGYDALQRVTSVSQGGGINGSNVRYYYDTPYGTSGYSQNVRGRLATVLWRANSPKGTLDFTEMYKYSGSGLVLGKRLTITRSNTNSKDIDLTFTYDHHGNLLSYSVPTIYSSGKQTYTYSYNGLGRPVRLVRAIDDVASPYQTHTDTMVSSASYGPAGELTQLVAIDERGNNLTYTENRTYNARLQMTRLQATVTGGRYTYPERPPQFDYEYRYKATGNDGRLWQAKDWISGEEVTYQYDNLGRLISAVTTGPEWGQTFGYDGFGNLNNIGVTKGSAPMLNLLIDQSTNRIATSGFTYDAAGDVTRMPGITSLNYDAAGKLVQTTAGGESKYYVYGAGGLKSFVYNGSESVTLYGVRGERLGTCGLVTQSYLISGCYLNDVYFGSRLLFRGPSSMPDLIIPDLTGSVKATMNWSGSATATRWSTYPYGGGQQQFTSYIAEGNGLSYAMNRFYASSQGRFLTPDPSNNSQGMQDPQSWNRYAFVGGDPVNRTDALGLFWHYVGTTRVKVGVGPIGEGSEMVDADVYMWDPGVILPVRRPGEDKPVPLDTADINHLRKPVNIAVEALSKKPCSDLFSGHDPAEILKSMTTTSGKYGSIVFEFLYDKDKGQPSDSIATLEYTSSNASAASGWNTNIVVNAYDSAKWFGGYNSNYNNQFSQDQRRAATLIHELGHVFENYFGAASTTIVYDGTNPELSWANTDMVMEKCFGWKPGGKP